MSTPSTSKVKAERPSIGHLPALDGLRGTAVIGVLFFHADQLRGGYLGVDLFFVLSGFLITSLLIAEHRGAGRIRLGAFWIRRARRLLPAVLSLVPAVAVYTWLFAKPSEWARIRGDGIATLAYVANWRSIFAGKSYWDLFNAPSPLEHTWSLAIEEQFYVFWPLMAWFVLARFQKSVRALFVLSAVLAVSSAAAMFLLFDPQNSSRVYMGTDSRGASILVGAALACFLGERSPIQNTSAIKLFDGLGALSLAGLGAAWVWLEGQNPFLYKGGFWLTEACVLILIVCATLGQRSFIARVFSFAPLRWVGLVSYGVYLWHWPLYCVLTKQRTGMDGWTLTTLRIGATFVVAYISYRFFEQPIRKNGLPFGRPFVVVPAAFALSIAPLLFVTRGAAEPTAASNPLVNVPQIFGNYNDNIRELPPPDEVSKGTQRVLVLGDSVAVAMGDRLRFMQDAGPAKVAVRASGDCNILDEQFTTKSLNNRRHEGGDCDSKWQADALELKPDVALVVLGGAFFAPVQIDGDWRNACDDKWNRAIVAELSRNLLSLSQHSKKVVVALVPYPVEHWASDKWNRATDCFNNAVREVVAADTSTKVSLLDLKSQICPGGDHTSCVLKDSGAPIRPDGMHFEGKGAEAIARWTLQQIR
ncbi:MAG: acyltransferase [Polyangiaceae bacterium]|nr:acyltransferase [Polyangiaceae bacterium]